MADNPFDHLPDAPAQTEPANPFDHLPSKPYDSDQGPDKNLPVWLRRDNAFMRASRLLESGATAGLANEIVPVSKGVEAHIRTGSAEKGAEAYHQAKQEGEEARQNQREHGTLGALPEIIGGLGGLRVSTPAAAQSAFWRSAPLAEQYAAAGQNASGGFGKMIAANTGVGGTLGAVQGATSGDGTLGERLANTAVGAGIGAGLGAGLGTVGYGLGKMAGVIGRDVSDTANAGNAANRRIAEAFDEADIPLEGKTGVRSVIAPQSKYATTDAEVSEIVRRFNEGQTRKQIAQDMGLTPGVVSERIAQFNDKSRVPTNLIDATKFWARGAERTGADSPVTELAQTTAGLGHRGARLAAERMGQRQVDQPERLAEHLQLTTGGPELATRKTQLLKTIGEQSDEAYDAAREAAQPFDLAPSLSKARLIEHNSAGDIKKGLSSATDLFFKPAILPREAESLSPTVDDAALYLNRYANPIDNVPQYLEARAALDQKIAASYENMKPTPLTRRLTQLRKEIDGVVKKENPLLAKADADFSEAKTSQGIIDTAQQSTLKAGVKQDENLAFFDSLNDEQKDLFRTTVKEKLMGEALGTEQGGGNPTRKYTSGKAKDYLRHIFQEKEADRLINDITKENITTESLRHVFGGSRTAPLMNRMQEYTEGAHLAADLATANVPGLIRRIGSRVYSGISSKAAEAVLERLTNMEPDKVLPYIDQIIKAGQYNKRAISRNMKGSYMLGTGLGQGARIAANDAYFEPKPLPPHYANDPSGPVVKALREAELKIRNGADPAKVKKVLEQHGIRPELLHEDAFRLPQ